MVTPPRKLPPTEVVVEKSRESESYEVTESSLVDGGRDAIELSLINKESNAAESSLVDEEGEIAKSSLVNNKSDLTKSSLVDGESDTTKIPIDETYSDTSLEDNDSSSEESERSETSPPQQISKQKLPYTKPRFGSRFKINKGPLMSQKYFPPDHVHDQAVQHFTNIISNEERKVLNSMSKELSPYIPHFHKVLNSSEIDRTKLGNPKYKTTIISERFDSMVVQSKSESFCQGCKVPKEYRIRFAAKGDRMEIYRKFVGNNEIINPDLNFTCRIGIFC